jgi:predicted porin
MSSCRYLTGVALGLALVVTSAQAQMRDPLPDSLSLGGVTLYGTIDVGYAYQSNGVPLSSTLPGGLEYQAFTTTRNFAGSQSTAAESGLEQSKIGIRVSQPIAPDWTLVARVETGINPLSGQLTDACASIAQNAHNAQGSQTANADSSRCGQFFNAQAFGGISNKDLGTLTIGRQNSIQLDATAAYDPQAVAYAFSFLGYSGFDGGSGSTETARWDNSVKYAYQSGPIHLNLMYSAGAQDAGLFGKAFGVGIGGTFAGLSVDATYQNIKGAVNLRSSFDDASYYTGAYPNNGLAAYESDDTSWNIMGKYTVDLGATAATSDKLTIYAGYSHIQKADADYPVGDAQGAYPIDVGIAIENPAVYNFEWLGLRYAMTTGWTVSVGLYHITQNSWTIGTTGATPITGIGCAAAGLLCSGDFNEGSVVLDYAFNKHYDIYGGVNYSEVEDGLANGFVGTTVGTSGSENQTTVMLGFRVRF